jgi:hypothetical protein
LDEVGGGVPVGERGESDLDLARKGVCRQPGLDGSETHVGGLDRRAGHHAHEFVAADTNDQVIGAQMTADRVDRVLQQRVAGAVTVCVVDRLQADHVDVRDSERRHRSAGTSDLVIKVLQARRPRACAGQPVVLSRRQLRQQRIAFCVGLEHLTSSPVAITRRLCAIDRRPGTTFSRRGAVSCGAAAVLGRPQHHFRLATDRGSILRRERAITQLRDLIALQRGQISRVRDLITRGGCRHPPAALNCRCWAVRLRTSREESCASGSPPRTRSRSLAA